MNYVGSISILDRGDAPAQAVIDRNARSLAQRAADETKEELNKVLTRVDHIYGNFELSENLSESNRTASLEYVQDLGELEDLLKDQVKKKKYQQHVTIFIVGYENVCGQKLKLLQQVNEFFVENASKFDEEDMLLASPDLDLDDMEEAVEETLRQTESLANKLVNLKKGLDDHMHNLTQMKASNKAKKTKELEKDLTAAKKQLDAVNNSLRELAREVKEKSEKIDQLQRDIEKRNVDVLRYKHVAEEAKKAGNYEKTKEEATAREEQIRELKMEIEHLKVELAKEVSLKEEALKHMVSQSDSQQAKMRELQNALEEQVIAASESMEELQRLHEQEVTDIKQQHDKDVQELKTQHAEEIRTLLQGSGPVVAKELSTEPGDRSRPVTKEASRLSRQGSQERQDSKASSQKSEASKPSSRQTNRSRGSNKPSKESSNVTTDEQTTDDGEDATHKAAPRTNAKTRSNLEPVQEVPMEFEDEYELLDENSWSQFPTEHLPGRFLQYRQLTKKKLEELEGQIDSTVKKTARKVNTLKAQFQEHKTKWENERGLLINHLDQAQELQTEAEKEADIAINTLEDIINDQEEIEKEEEEKMAGMEHNEREASLTLEEAQANLQQTLEEKEHMTKQLEDQLLAQTDDAKAELSRKTTKASDQSAGESGEEEPVTQSPEKSLLQEELLSHISGRTRSSLQERRHVLSSLKASADERRAKSPSVYSVRSLKSVLSDADLDEDGDMPFPMDESKEQRQTRLSLHDMATSPMPLSREKTDTLKGIPMAEHPVVQEFIKTYQSVVQFKDNLSRAFMDKEMMSLGQVLNEIEPIEFNSDSKVQPQVEEMQKNVSNVLEETMMLLIDLMASDREYPVSSLLGFGSKEPTRTGLYTRESVKELADRAKSRATQGSRMTQASVLSKASTTKEHLKELQEMYSELQAQYGNDQNKHEEQLNHNTVVMMEMQDTINTLQRELSSLGHQAAALEHKQQDETVPPDAPLMFTRLDSERNAKIMKRAVNEQRLDPRKYEEALETMDEYISLPAKRLTHLVRKYVHHTHMKQVEDNVRSSKSLDDDVIHVLDKMEVLQNERAKRWAQRMDDMGDDRMRLAGNLMVTLDDIEKESGVFLIKPIYSYKANFSPEKYQGKLSRAYRPSGQMYSRTSSAYAPVPTPASNVRPSKSLQEQSIGMDYRPKTPSAQSPDGVMGKSSQLFGEYPRPVWNQSSSTGGQDIGRFNPSLPGQINTPRILELDINRMLIGQNQVSLKIPQGLLSNDRLSNAANTSTRSYVTVNRPAGQHSHDNSERPRSHTGVSEAPPTTPQVRDHTPNKTERSHTAGSSYSTGSKHVALQNSETVHSPRSSPGLTRGFSATPPLPPITSDSPRDKHVSATDSLSSLRSGSDGT